jgi:hypothetical protein
LTQSKLARRLDPRRAVLDVLHALFRPVRQHDLVC